MDHTHDHLADKPKRLDAQQYDLLKRCAAAHDAAEWNQWRQLNPVEEILLEGADLADAHLEGVNLSMANLRGAGLVGAHLQGAYLNLADLRRCHLSLARLDGAGLSGANLTGADLTGAHLDGAYLLSSNLARAELRESHLNGTTIYGANLSGASFSAAIVDGGTYIWDCAIDNSTQFLGVGIDGARVEPGLKQLLEYNVRRHRWQTWYQRHNLQKWPVRLFWLMSDYGRSTGRIVVCFFAFAMFFALLYWAFPSMVANLEATAAGPIKTWLVPIRALYFSVVTMTTLGFGDLHANPNSLGGHLLLMTQVVLGYLVLGALLTRFSILFSAGGPEVDIEQQNQMWDDEE